MDKIIQRHGPKMDSLSASPRIFANPLLDKLSRTHHLVPLLVYLPVVLVLLGFAATRLTWPAIIAAMFGGYLVWTILEYLGHRYFFHLALPGRFGRRIHFLIHGVHHDYPSDPLRLVMPLLMSVPIQVAAFLTLREILGADLMLPVFAGFVTGYIGYDTLHFHMHHGRSTLRLVRALRRRHMYHHFQDDKSWYGVSAPWWDSVFHTLPRPRASSAAH